MVLPSWTRPVLVRSLPSGQMWTLRSLSNVKSARENVPSSRTLMSQTGICGVMPFPISQPRNFTGAICRISSETVRFKSQSFLGSHDHCLCRRDFVIGAGGSGFHIDDHGVLNVDQIIEPVAELNALVGLRRPGRARIDR